jgi:hypothetical protein
MSKIGSSFDISLVKSIVQGENSPIRDKKTFTTALLEKELRKQTT